MAEPTPEEQLAEAQSLLRDWLEWFSMRPGKLYMAPSGMTRKHLVKDTEMWREGQDA